MYLNPKRRTETEQEIKNLHKEYISLKGKITQRLKEFKAIWKNGSDEDVFYELIFCLMTPQSKAILCWESVKRIRKIGIKKVNEPEEIQPLMIGVRFKYKKSEYILEARDKFLHMTKFNIKKILLNEKTILKKREWLVNNIKGIGYKEAGHFLRNIGFGSSVTILDRHILKNLKMFGVIENYPSTLSVKKYLEIEKKMFLFSYKIEIPPDHLDLLFWYKQTGTIFK